jgi:hypothetical protein
MVGPWFAIALDWLLVVATIFDNFKLLEAFWCTTNLALEILLGDQIQNMLARTSGNSTAAADP